MPGSLQRLVVAAGLAAGGAVQLQAKDDRSCTGSDETAFVSMIKKVNTFPRYHLGHDEYEVAHHMRADCWAMKVYNTNEKMTSALWQSEADGRCVLAISAYHADPMQYMKANTDQATPRTTWNVCNNSVFAPWVKLLRQHSRLENWTRIASALGSDESTCKGEVLVAGHAAGGAVAETLATCVNGNHTHDVLPSGAQPFRVGALYTFGAPATAKKPMANPLDPNGCFRGKRFINDNDAVAAPFWLKGMDHSMYDSVEISEKEVGPTFKVTPCLNQKQGPAEAKHEALVAHMKSSERSDVRPQEISTYERSLKLFSESGYSQFVAPDLLDPSSDTWANAVAAKAAGPAKEISIEE